MNKLILLIGFVLFANAGHTQIKNIDTVQSKNVIPPQFPKGAKGWKRFVSWKMDDFTAEPNYPKGDFIVTAVVVFTIDTTGTVTDIKTYKSSGSTKIDKYAIRVLESSPKWTPATDNGQKINYQVYQSIQFEGREL